VLFNIAIGPLLPLPIAVPFARSKLNAIIFGIQNRFEPRRRGVFPYDACRDQYRVSPGFSGLAGIPNAVKKKA
jgi:hypothetical protein